MPRAALSVWLAACASAAITVAPRALAEGAPATPSATASCEKKSGPGRVRCEIELVAPGARIRWADAQVVTAPPFVTVLKGRLAGTDVTARTPDRWRFSFGLVARSKGAGELSLRVRAVTCGPSADAPCETLTLPITAPISAGER